MESAVLAALTLLNAALGCDAAFVSLGARMAPPLDATRTLDRVILSEWRHLSALLDFVRREDYVRKNNVLGREVFWGLLCV